MAGVCLWANAQQQNIKPLTVGDSVPDITFTNLINYPTQTVKLSDFKGKLVILDFWATWCLSCIANIPKIQKLQDALPNDLQVFLINSSSTGDSEKTIVEFISEKSKHLKLTNIPVVPEEKITYNLFPYNALPHYVWIKDKKIVAITGSEDLTELKIKEANSSLPINTRPKKDIDRAKLLYLQEEAPLKNLLHYSIVFKGQLYDLSGGSGVFSLRSSQNNIDGVLIGNYSLYNIYRLIADEVLPGYDDDTDARILIQTNDTSGLYFNSRDKQARIAWRRRNAYTLELHSPSTNRRDLFRKVLDEVNKATDYIGTIDHRDVRCLVLEKAHTTKGVGILEKIFANKDSVIKITDLRSLKTTLKAIRSENLLFVDSTNIGAMEKFDVRLPSNMSDLRELKSALLQNNLLLTEKTLRIPMLIIKKKF